MSWTAINNTLPLEELLVQSGVWKRVVVGRGMVVVVEHIDVENIDVDTVTGIIVENGYVCLLHVIRNHMPTLNLRLTNRNTSLSVIHAINCRPRSDDGYLYEILDQVASFPLHTVSYIDNTLTANNQQIWPLTFTPMPPQAIL